MEAIPYTTQMMPDLSLNTKWTSITSFQLKNMLEEGIGHDHIMVK